MRQYLNISYKNSCYGLRLEGTGIFLSSKEGGGSLSPLKGALVQKKLETMFKTNNHN